MKNKLKVTVGELLEEGGMTGDEVFAGCVIAANGRVVLKYGDRLEVKSFKSQESIEIASDLMQVIAKLRH